MLCGNVAGVHDRKEAVFNEWAGEGVSSRSVQQLMLVVVVVVADLWFRFGIGSSPPPSSLLRFLFCWWLTCTKYFYSLYSIVCYSLVCPLPSHWCPVCPSIPADPLTFLHGGPGTNSLRRAHTLSPFCSLHYFHFSGAIHQVLEFEVPMPPPAGLRM